MIEKDVGIIQPKIKNLEKEGLIELKDGSKKNKIPHFIYDDISICLVLKHLFF
ncbi:hypothetical protein [Methanobrevibacter filiformis]|uniref:Uncharacterized protein n=1 Tax=Methanobrevibacter filiformis TaxID=55758 RepID=A0A166EVC3_9EURY|nr:hypothetical protein [Methanobrevibacter filiformis]KZX17054.1 hypothetical protein MBFIL_03880 [Methanobrevibacter filiformis]